MRLYHVDTRVDTIDGVQVTTHTFELYMAIDEKMEIRIQPYMSNACIVHNFQPCLQEADLPKTKFIRPKSIYDNRYASVRHRHYDYERRIWELTLEADQIWKNFKNYLTIDQGTDNAHKVMLTDKDGKIYAAEDNMVRHCEPTEKNPDTNEGSRRVGEKVLVTGPKVKRTIENCSTPLECSCVEESDVTLDELYQLKNVRKNIQEQIDDLWKALKAVSDELLDTLGDVAGDIWENIGDVWNALDQLGDLLGQLEGALANAAQGDFVRKTGDIMTGSLWIQYDGKKFKEVPSDYDQNESFCGVKFFSDDSAAQKGGYIYGASHNSCVGLGVARDKRTDREEDWALAVTPAIDSQGIPIMLNGTKIMFTRDGRIDGRNATTFTIDFDKINEFYKEEKGTYPIDRE